MSAYIIRRLFAVVPVMAVVALFVSTLFEGFRWQALTVLGVAVSVAGNVLVLGGRR